MPLMADGVEAVAVVYGASPYSAVILRHRVSPLGEPDDRLERSIQYSEALKFNASVTEYWVTRFRG